MSYVTEAEVFRACRTLFGPELQLTRDFLSYLQADGVRSAYRKKAKVIHPDKFSVAADEIRIRQQRQFQDLNQAHQTVLSYLKQRKPFVRTNSFGSRPAYRQQPPQYQRNNARSYPQRGPLPARPLQFGLFSTIRASSRSKH